MLPFKQFTLFTTLFLLFEILISTRRLLRVDLEEISKLFSHAYAYIICETEICWNVSVLCGGRQYFVIGTNTKFIFISIRQLIETKQF